MNKLFLLTLIITYSLVGMEPYNAEATQKLKQLLRDACEPEEVKSLILEGADPNARNRRHYQHYPALWVAIFEGIESDLAHFLLTHNADPNIKLPAGSTPLMWASYIGRSDIVEALLEHGADKTMRDEGSKTALDWARSADEDAPEVVQLLNMRKLR